MRLASFQAEGATLSGVLVEGRLLPVPGGMLEIIEGGAAQAARIESAVAAWRADPAGTLTYDPAEVTWLAPVPNPSKIVCLALNNSANADRVMRGPKHPATFVKGANALTGHKQPVACRPYFGRVHPEPELAVVIGRKARRVLAKDAYDYVFGYTIHNDITSPTMREEDTFHYRAIHPSTEHPGEIAYKDSWVSYSGRYKGADSFSPMGPYVVTRDEIADPHNLRIACLHNDELVTEDNTGNLFFKIPEVIAFVTDFMTLEPGDILSMGTALKPSGAGGVRRAVQNIDMHRDGGVVAIEIEGLGRLESGVTRD